jgi:hypothetical protein
MTGPHSLPAARRRALPAAVLRARMAERVQGFSGGRPVWARARRPSWRRPCPGHVRLGAVVPAARMLWSDSALRDVRLNGGPWSRTSGVVQEGCDGLFRAEVRHVARAGAGMRTDGSAEGVHGA